CSSDLNASRASAIPNTVASEIEIRPDLSLSAFVGSSKMEVRRRRICDCSLLGFLRTYFYHRIESKTKLPNPIKIKLPILPVILGGINLVLKWPIVMDRRTINPEQLTMMIKPLTGIRIFLMP